MKRNYNLLLSTLNAVLYLVVILLWLAIPESTVLNLAVSTSAITLSLFLIYLNHEKFKAFYESSLFKRVSETIIFVILIFSLLGVLNYWFFKHPKQADLSLYRLNSLTEQSKSILKKIDGKIHFKIFARKNESFLWYTLLDLYRFHKSDITIEKIDIDVRPDLVLEYGINSDSVVVIEFKNKKQFVTERDELNITNGLIKISRDHDPVVYFASGVGEADFRSKEQDGLQYIFSAISNSAIDVRTINLKTAQEIPFDAKVLIVWGPKEELSSNEISVLKKFLERGGNLMIGLDPNLNIDAHKNIRSFMLDYHINWRNDLVLDKRNFVNGSNGTIPLVENFNQKHAITEKMKGQVFFPLVSSVEVYDEGSKEADESIEFLTQGGNFPDSWGETSIKEIASGKPSYSAGVDLAGPLSLALSYSSNKNKIVVWGNSTFVLNAYMKYGSNYNLFLNALSWLVDEDRLISFNLPIIQNEKMFISAPQFGTIFYFSVIFSPLLLFATSFFMYRRRRTK